MSNERLNEIGYLLMGAGSDDGVMMFNRPDTILLGLINCDEIVEVTHHPSRMMGYLDPNAPLPKPTKEMIPAVEPIKTNAEDRTEVVRSFQIHVGTARKALKEKMGGRPLEGLRQPDVQAPMPEEEPAQA